MLSRRNLLAGALAAALPGPASGPARAQGGTFRIGYQKNGILVVAKQQGAIEQALKPLGVSVRWTEFSFGPPVLEALGVGAIDFGQTGAPPPVFAQAAGNTLLYVAAQDAGGSGEAILVPPGSPLTTLADLKGRRVAFAKGSSAHYLVVRALEKAGLAYADIEPVTLAPADAAAAFARGAVDAWAIWDPYLASGERSTGGRILVDGTDLVPNRQFYLSTRAFAATHGPALDATLAAIGEIDAWAKENTDAVAAELSPSVGIPAPILTVALRRLTYGVTPLNAETTADQQKVADTFHRLGLLPKPLDVASAVRKPGS